MRRVLATGLGLVLGFVLVAPASALAEGPPGNNDLAAATEVSLGALPVTFSDVDIATATFEPGERLPWATYPGAPTSAPTVWYTFAYPSINSGVVLIEAPGAKVTAFYAQYGPGLAGLSAGYTRNSSSLLIPFFAERVDFVQVAGDGSSDPITVTFSFIPRPPNDDIAAAATVAPPSDTAVDTRTATVERSGTQPSSWELGMGGCFYPLSWAFGRSVWYRLTVPTAGKVVVDPAQSSFADVTLSAWAFTGAGFSDMTRAGCATARTPLSFSVQPYRTYYVQAVDAVPAGGQLSGGGQLLLHWSLDQPPVLTVPVDMTVEATGPGGAAVTYAVSASDAVDGPVAVSCDRPSGSPFPIGSTTVSCSAGDSSGNTAIDSFTVTVVDTVAPTVEYGSHPATYTVADTVHITCSVADAVGVQTTTCADIDGFGWSFGLGAHTYAASATDAVGNVGSATTQFTVIATYPSMSDLSQQWVTKAGIARDLIALLDSAAAAEARGQFIAEANKLADYRALVRAQSGKALTPARAQMLITFSYGL